MKKERIRKPDGRYLIYYSFDTAEIVPRDRSSKQRARRPRSSERRGR